MTSLTPSSRSDPILTTTVKLTPVFQEKLDAGIDATEMRIDGVRYLIQTYVVVGDTVVFTLEKTDE